MEEITETGSFDSRKKVDAEIASRFARWSFERFNNIPPKIMEAKARMQIALSAKKDLDTGGKIEEKLYNKRFETIKKELDRLQIDEKIELRSSTRIDSITKQDYFVRIRKEGDFYVSEEIAINGRIISQSKLSSDGKTQLTLHFRDNRYLVAHADPGLSRSDNFPRAALSTFELLVKTM